ncbi:legumain-like [Homarus americanus]|uniref:legumain-like n=1 Tax=Homarus americanus TaxID=6706 RepID=UPI001C4943EF|nr:legumain-like [Homarus americanus]
MGSSRSWSSSWFNYRHQADVCHAYQILHQHGVADDHIIVMMYDDIANNSMNPHPGVIINRPGGPNVYTGVPKDYTGKDVTPQNFLKVLRGDAEGLRGVGSGRVLRSGPNDRVFINMVDHGAPGIFAFPAEYLSATALSNTFLKMHQEHRYRQMVVYVESCESGSLFQRMLPDDIEVYAVSASSPKESSYACYLDDELDTYLGDVFSIKWMEDTDRENIHRETLKNQFLLVHHEVTTSDVMHWGQLKLAGQKLSRFLGSKNNPILDHNNPINLHSNHVNLPSNHGSKYNSRYSTSPNRFDPCVNTSVASHDVPLALLQSRVQRANTTTEAQYWKTQLHSVQLNRALVKTLMHRLIEEVVNDEEMLSKIIRRNHQHDITRWDCYLASVRSFHARCFDIAQNTYALRVLKNLVNLCEHGYTADQVDQATRSVCTHQAYTGII